MSGSALVSVMLADAVPAVPTPVSTSCTLCAPAVTVGLSLVPVMAKFTAVLAVPAVPSLT